MLKSLIITIQFLTRLPINIKVNFDNKALAKGTVYFPFVGMLIGAISGGIYLLIFPLNRELAALLAVLSITIITGGLHIDGLSDTVDGFFSGRGRERVLEIMKDSRVGTFGVLAIVFDILIKYVLIKNIDANSVFIFLILACGNGRISSSMMFSFGKTARPGGMGDIFTSNNTKPFFIIGAALYFVAGVILCKYTFIMSFILVLLFSFLLKAYSYKVIGGLTGDVYGAAVELSEIISLLCFLVVKLWI